MMRMRELCGNLLAQLRPHTLTTRCTNSTRARGYEIPARPRGKMPPYGGYAE